MGEFAIKVSPFSGAYSGGALRGKDTSCGWGWCEPILVGGLTYIGRHRDLYSFIVGPILVAPLTYIGCYDLPHGGSGGGSGGASDGGGEDRRKAVPLETAV